jgi:hypothetical protein
MEVNMFFMLLNPSSIILILTPNCPENRILNTINILSYSFYFFELFFLLLIIDFFKKTQIE